MKINQVTDFNRNQTLSRLKINQSTDINRIILRHELDNTSNNINYYQNFFCIRKVRDIILISIILSIILSLIIFLIEYYSKENNKAIIFKQNLNNTNELDGYYIPKDRISNPIYKICSIDKCKKCYGNSLNDTCISCFDSYKPIIDENNKTVSCQYIEDNNITIKERSNLEDKTGATIEEITDTFQNNHATTIEKIEETTQEIKYKAGTTILEITEITQEIKYKAATTIEEIAETTQEIKNKVDTTIEEIKETTQNINYIVETTIEENIETTQELKYKTASTYSDIKTDNLNHNINYSTENEQKIIQESFNIQNQDIISYAILKYETNQLNEQIQLLSNKTEDSIKQGFFNRENSKFNLIDIEKNISIKSYNYTFDNIGTHLKKLEFKENIYDFSYMFYKCNNLIAITENFLANNVINFKGMFKGCSSLKYIENIQEWNVSQVVDFSYMFANCYSLNDINNLSSWNTSKGINFNNMFFNCFL